MEVSLDQYTQGLLLSRILKQEGVELQEGKQSLGGAWKQL